jgi:hypothetical protein
MAWEIVSRAEVSSVSGMNADELRDDWYNMVVGILHEVTPYELFHTTTTITDEVHDGDGTNLLVVNRPPIVSISSISIDGVAVSSTCYTAYGNFVKLSPSEENLLTPIFPKGVGNVTISYTSGFSTVPTDIKLGVINAIEIIALHKKRGASTADLRYDSAADQDGSPEPGVPYASLAYTIRKILRTSIGRKRINFA